ncbi:MAG: lipopolysaccharide biosynthesis protein [Actinomycetota bacterium]
MSESVVGAAGATPNVGLRLLRASALTMAVRAGAGVAAVLTFALLSRVLGADQFGKFASGTSLALAASQAAGRGAPTTVLRFLAKYSVSDHDKAAAVRRWADRRVAIGALGSVALLGLAALAQLAQNEDALYVVAAGPVLVAMTFTDLRSHQLRGIGHLPRSLFGREVFWRLTMLAAAGALLLFGADVSAGFVLLVSAGLLALGGLVQHRWLVKRLSPSAPGAGADPAWNTAAIGNWGLAVLRTAVPHGSVVVVGAVLSFASAGLLFSSLRLAGLMSLPLTALDFAIAPRISRHAGQESREQLQGLLTASIRLLTPISILSAVILAAAAEFLLQLFDPSVASSPWPLRVIVAGALLNALCGPTVPLLQMAGQERFLFLARLVATAIGATLVLSAVFYGVVMAAVGVAVAQVGWNIAAVARARRALGVDPSVLALVGRHS